MDRSAEWAFPRPMNGWGTGAAPDATKCLGSSCHGPPGTGKTDAVRLLVSRVRGTFLECDMREVEGRKLGELILKGQEPRSSPDIGWHLEHRHGRDGRV